jgi:hypothetical protein
LGDDALEKRRLWVGCYEETITHVEDFVGENQRVSKDEVTKLANE